MMSQRCARPGCRAWAVRGGEYCVAHRAPASDAAESDVSERLERSNLFAELVRTGRHEELVERTIQQLIDAGSGDLSLEQEIASLRLILRRVMAVDALEGDPGRTAQTVARLANAIAYNVRAQRAISGQLADDLTGALTVILTEMGVGGAE